MEKEELLNELKERMSVLKDNVQKVKVGKDFKYYKYIASDLRVLLDEKNKGNNLLHRTLSAFGQRLIFRYKKPWGEIIEKDLESWKDDVVLVIQRKQFSRIVLIRLVANQRGAHFDSNADILHTLSQKTKMPFGNPAKDGISEQNIVFITKIAEDLVRVVENQFLKKYA